MNDSKFKRLKSKSGQPYFNLKATNYKIIETSEMYSSESGMRLSTRFSSFKNIRSLRYV
ncbi:MAG: YegP family protein [Lutibacter sp.]